MCYTVQKSRRRCAMRLIDREYVRSLMPRREPAGHKGTFGKAYLLGGSVGYTGAPVLCAAAAERSGCGLVFLGVPESVWPSARVAQHRITAILAYWTN